MTRLAAEEKERAAAREREIEIERKRLAEEMERAKKEEREEQRQKAESERRMKEANELKRRQEEAEESARKAAFEQERLRQQAVAAAAAREKEECFKRICHYGAISSRAEAEISARSIRKSAVFLAGNISKWRRKIHITEGDQTDVARAGVWGAASQKLTWRQNSQPESVIMPSRQMAWGGAGAVSDTIAASNDGSSSENGSKARSKRGAHGASKSERSVKSNSANAEHEVCCQLREIRLFFFLLKIA
ncbi:unnamed protein product [Gongylonema pulchrum]|uniref:Uncharacterized protein n=1 Tax=Gongylonema pulchrum TaxID=637853 RepID=A0A3P7PDG4_9BILA|nr:unnamed protein product [Gongylonema pulchrum]